MRDALGGAVNVVIIVTFIVVVLGYLAFNVNYTKAFRMKNKIIATYEEYDGVCDSQCQQIINQYASDIGYHVASGNMTCRANANGVTWSKDSHSNYCYAAIKVLRNSATDSVDEGKDKVYYKIATKINIEIPIIQNVFNLQMFWVTGDTKAFSVN